MLVVPSYDSLVQMDKRIELELRGRDPSEVTELNLDNCRATAVTGLTEEFRSLETLSMINVGLTSLKGLPALPSLQRLDLSENRIAANLDQLLCCPHIQYLNLAGNKISTLEALEPLKKLKELKALDLFGCELATGDDYRKNIFEVLPNLKYLDGYDVNDEEAESDSEIIQENEDEEDEENDDDGLDGTDEEEDGDDEENSEVGLDYLQSSTLMQDEDETEDFAPGDEEETDEAGAPRGVKRKHDADDDEEEKGIKREA